MEGNTVPWWEIPGEDTKSSSAMQLRSLEGMDGPEGPSWMQVEFKEVADSFAREELLPFSSAWDQAHTLPLDTLRRAAELGFAGLFVSEEHGGRMESHVRYAGRRAMLTTHSMVMGMEVERCGGRDNGRGR